MLLSGHFLSLYASRLIYLPSFISPRSNAMSQLCSACIFAATGSGISVSPQHSSSGTLPIYCSGALPSWPMSPQQPHLWAFLLPRSSNRPLHTHTDVYPILAYHWDWKLLPHSKIESFCSCNDSSKPFLLAGRLFTSEPFLCCNSAFGCVSELWSYTSSWSCSLFGKSYQDLNYACKWPLTGDLTQ